MTIKIQHLKRTSPTGKTHKVNFTTGPYKNEAEAKAALAEYLAKHGVGSAHIYFPCN